jgi:hypothetical protein
MASVQKPIKHSGKLMNWKAGRNADPAQVLKKTTTPEDFSRGGSLFRKKG